MAKHRREPLTRLDGSNEILAHLRMAWDAEVENARRLAQRTTLLITIEAALLGVGATQFGASDAAPGRRPWILLATALALSGLVFLLRPRHRGREPATSSRFLAGNLETLTRVTEASATRARTLLFRLTACAVEDLGARNARKQRDIDRAQVALLLASLALAGGMFASVLDGLPS